MAVYHVSVLWRATKPQWLMKKKKKKPRGSLGNSTTFLMQIGKSKSGGKVGSKFMQFLSYRVKYSFTWLHREKPPNSVFFYGKNFSLGSTSLWELLWSEKLKTTNICHSFHFLSIMESLLKILSLRMWRPVCDVTVVHSPRVQFSLKLCAAAQLPSKFWKWT